MQRIISQCGLDELDFTISYKKHYKIIELHFDIKLLNLFPNMYVKQNRYILHNTKSIIKWISRLQVKLSTNAAFAC